ncbi:MAG TPA: polysaccharide biosynthesis tyrosine autokinase [Tepidisphaeraceae bacterium]|nr:polysaccharide biosynthesis tyrosine autokinase [Tepidisphaeraceae bacterium]
MTTLPQTSPMRVPRPGNQQVSIPGAGALGPMPQPHHFIPSTTGMSGADVWRVIRANLWLIISMLVLFGVGGFLLNTYLATHYPRYEAVGLVQVHTTLGTPTVGSEVGVDAREDIGGLGVEIASQVKEIMHPTLLSMVLTQNDDIRKTSWFQKFVKHNSDGSAMLGADGKPLIDTEAAKEDLAEILTVNPYPNSRLIQVAATCSNPADCKTIIEAVVNQHISVVRTAEENNELKNQDYFRTLQQTTTFELTELGTKINHLEMELGNLGEDLESGTSVTKFELETLTAETLKADQAASDAKDKLDLFNSQINSGLTPPEVEERYMGNPAYWDYRRALDEAEIDERMDSRGDPGSESSPQRLSAQKEHIQLLQQKLDDLSNELKNNAIAIERSQLQEDLKSAADTQSRYKKRCDELNAAIASIAARRNELEELKTEAREKRETLQHIQDRMDQINIIQEMAGWGTVDWADGGHPDIPSKPVFPKLSVVLGMSLFLGLALALGIAFLREMTDTSVRSPRDIARVGQLTVLGMIPHSDDDLQSQAARLPLVIYDAPHSMVAEQFRQVRTRLHHAASLDTTRSILVTGCGPGDGKTTVAANIAAGLALNGRRILLVDANFRRPDLHNIFNLSNELGFGDVLGSISLFEQAIRETEVPNLSVIVNGTRPSNPTELLESQLFIDFIERALEEFDHVIFDSGPLLIVSETIAMAPRVDGVVTVIRARTNSRGMLSRMRDQLRQLKAEHLGVILNAVRSQGGGYYGPMIKAYYAYQNGDSN